MGGRKGEPTALQDEFGTTTKAPRWAIVHYPPSGDDPTARYRHPGRTNGSMTPSPIWRRCLCRYDGGSGHRFTTRMNQAAWAQDRRWGDRKSVRSYRSSAKHPVAPERDGEGFQFPTHARSVHGAAVVGAKPSVAAAIRMSAKVKARVYTSHREKRLISRPRRGAGRTLVYQWHGQRCSRPVQDRPQTISDLERKADKSASKLFEQIEAAKSGACSGSCLH